MIKIEAQTLEDAYKNAASSLDCSVTQLKIEVIQYPSGGILGLFKKSAIIVAMKENKDKVDDKSDETLASALEVKKKQEQQIQIQPKQKKPQKPQKQKKPQSSIEQEIQKIDKSKTHSILNDTIMPESFVSTQDEHDEIASNNSYLSKDNYSSTDGAIEKTAQLVKKDINALFEKICFDIEEIQVNAYDENTLLIEFRGEDSALLIGKEGYRYKALSYMIFNWINTKYQVQLRLEIAEFLKNQEESISRYLVSVCENVERDGRTQTKVLDGVLVQIALKELRNIYPNKYVAIRSTRDGMKYIIINNYHSN